jgi:hypothetical protein
MREKLQEYALIAEIVGGLAVMITLVFLVIETQKNTNAIQAQMYQNLISELNELRESAASSPDAAELGVLVAQNGIESLTPVQQEQFRSRRTALWGVYESAYFARERDVLGDSEWSRFSSLICRNYEYSNSIDIWASGRESRNISLSLTSEFRAFVEDLCA